MFRKTGLVLLVIVPAVALGWLYVARNGIVAGVAELALSRMFGAPAYVEGVSLAPLRMEAGFGRVAIVDRSNPAQYLLEMGPGRFKLLGGQLFAGRFVVRDFGVENLVLGRARPADEVPVPASDPAPAEGGASSGEGSGDDRSPDAADGGDAAADGSAADDAAAEDGGFSLSDVEVPELDLSALTQELDVERLTEGELRSVQTLREADAEARERLQAVEERLTTTDLPERAAALERDYRALNLDTRDPREMQRRLETLRELNGRAEALWNEADQLSARTRADLRAIEESIPRVPEEIAADVAAVRRLARLGSLNVSEVGELLFGQVVMERLAWVMDKVERVRGALASDEAEVEALPRRAGRWVTYPVTGRVYPRFVVQRMDFSGYVPRTGADGRQAEGERLRYTGRLRDLSSNARVWGEPLAVEAEAQSAGGERWDVAATFDRTGEVPRYMLGAAGTGVQFGPMALGGGAGGVLPHQATPQSGDTRLDFRMVGDELFAGLEVDARGVRFAFGEVAEGYGEVARAARELFAEVETVTLRAGLSGSVSDPALEVSSNVDGVFSERMSALLQQRIEAVEARIRAQVEQRVAAVRGEVEARVAERREALEARRSELVGRVDDLRTRIAERRDALQSRLNAVQRQAQQEADRARREAERRAREEAEERARSELERLIR